MIIPREKIPQPIQREVRQRCGFGCVICGNPIYDYDHMVDYAKTKRHIASELTLLCPNHHRDKTGRRIPLQKVLDANSNPHNIKTKRSSIYKIEQFYGQEASVILGTLNFVCQYKNIGNVVIPLLVDDVPIIMVSLIQGELFLDLVLCDENNIPILVIHKNELTYKIGFWDTTFIGSTLTIRQATRKIFLQIEFRDPNIVHVKKAKLFFNKKEFTIDNKGVKYENLNCSWHNFSIVANVGIVIGRNRQNIKGMFLVGNGEV